MSITIWYLIAAILLFGSMGYKEWIQPIFVANHLKNNEERLDK